ncbi:helicase SRCAP-like, partial [Vidua macroura]|uniref:helicase SRCAP-like n=1 Tax=Vidua macroura TaxID=187451 RepID=UPI0023A88D39
ESLESRRARGRAERLERLLRLNEQRCGLSPVYGREVLAFLTLPPRRFAPPGGALDRAVLRPPQRLQQMKRCWTGSWWPCRRWPRGGCPCTAAAPRPGRSGSGSAWSST